MAALLRQPRVWLGLAISVIALYIAFRGVSARELGHELATANYAWLLPTVAVIVAGQVARSVRWRILFGGGPRPSLADSFAILSIGYMVSAIFPLRLGDPIRAWLVETRTPASGAGAFATVLVERAIDFLTVAVLLAVWVPGPAVALLQTAFGAGRWASPRALGVVALGLIVAVYVACAALSAASARVGRVVASFLRRFGLSARMAVRLGALSAAFLDGFGPLRRPSTAAWAAAWSIVVWLLGALGTWLAMRSFRIDLPYASAVFVLCATALFAVLPSSPGYVGVFHSAALLGLTVYAEAAGRSVSNAAARSYVIVLHGLTMSVLILLGILGLAMIGLSRAELGRRLGVAGGPARPAGLA